MHFVDQVYVVAIMMTTCGTSFNCSRRAELPLVSTESLTKSQGGKMWTTNPACNEIKNYVLIIGLSCLCISLREHLSKVESD